ncbi:hypothetical protein ACPUGT_01165 [Klebsiella aerogenes]|uniref:hypothetical protein n=1 Tax=Klebsiella aerogenes TaxID=548 RepID=UPI003D3524A3
MRTQNISVNPIACESSDKSIMQDEDSFVFFRTETTTIFSMALKLDPAAEYVALFSFTTLAELKRQYPDMVLITEEEANARIEAVRAERKAKVEAILANSALERKVRNSGHKFIRISAGE